MVVRKVQQMVMPMVAQMECSMAVKKVHSMDDCWVDWMEDKWG